MFVSMRWKWEKEWKIGDIQRNFRKKMRKIEVFRWKRVKNWEKMWSIEVEERKIKRRIEILKWKWEKYQKIRDIQEEVRKIRVKTWNMEVGVRKIRGKNSGGSEKNRWKYEILKENWERLEEKLRYSGRWENIGGKVALFSEKLGEKSWFWKKVVGKTKPLFCAKWGGEKSLFWARSWGKFPCLWQKVLGESPYFGENVEECRALL